MSSIVIRRPLFLGSHPSLWILSFGFEEKVKLTLAKTVSFPLILNDSFAEFLVYIHCFRVDHYTWNLNGYSVAPF